MQRALRAIDVGTARELTARIRAVGEVVKKAAQERAPVGPGHPGEPGRLHDSIKVSTMLKSASVYSTAVYGGVQNVGGRVGRNHATLLRRDMVSGYMNKAVAASEAYVEGEMLGLLDWLETQWML